MKPELTEKRRQTLEDMFFHEQDRRIIERRAKLQQLEQTKANLATVSGIDDDALLEKLIALEIGPETLTTLIGIPLIEVAWADGQMDEKERKTLFEYAEKAGLRQKGLDPKIMSAWLKTKPDPALLKAWQQYVQKLCKKLNAHERERAPRRGHGRRPLGRRGRRGHPRAPHDFRRRKGHAEDARRDLPHLASGRTEMQVKRPRSDGIVQCAVALVAVLFGVATLIAGSRVLAGSDPGYVVFRPLLIYNTIMGMAYIAAGVLAWRNLVAGTYAAGTIAVLNVVVLLAVAYLYTTGGAVAIDSVRAMTLRTVVWLALLAGCVWLNRRRSRA